MSSTAASLATAERLNAMDLFFQFQAERRAFPRENITKLDTVYVSVFKGPRSSENVTRGEWQRYQTVYVVVQKKLPAENANQITESDQLTDFIELMEREFEADEAVGDFKLDRFDESVERLPFDVELIRESGVFSAFFGLVLAE